MSPQPQIESANDDKHAYKIKIGFLLCHNDTIYKGWLKSINYFKGGMYKHNCGQNLKLQSTVVTLNIRSSS